MKKIILGAFLIVASANAIENWNDIKPHDYGKENLTVNLVPGIYKMNSSNKGAVVSPFNGLELGIHSKASLKEYFYKKGEIFWAGGVNIAAYKPDISNISDMKIVNGNIEIGYSTNIYNNILLSVSSGGILKNSNKNAISNTISVNQYGGYIEGAAGINIKKWTLGGIYKLSYLKEKNSNNVSGDIRIPIQHNVDIDTAMVFTPEYTYTKNLTGSSNYKEYKFTIGFSWLYGY